MVVASTNVSTPLGAMYASAEMASCCMRMATTVKKVRSSLLVLGKDKLPQTLLEPGCFLPGVGTVLVQRPRLGHQKSPRWLKNYLVKGRKGLVFSWIHSHSGPPCGHRDGRGGCKELG